MRPSRAVVVLTSLGMALGSLAACSRPLIVEVRDADSKSPVIGTRVTVGGSGLSPLAAAWGIDDTDVFGRAYVRAQDFAYVWLRVDPDLVADVESRMQYASVDWTTLAGPPERAKWHLLESSPDASPNGELPALEIRVLHVTRTTRELEGFNARGWDQ